MLRRLRDQFDDELLIRHGRHYDLPPFAQSLAISVRQTILQVDSTISAKHARSGAVDLCVTGNPYSQAEAAAAAPLRADTLFPEVYCCVVHNDHPLRGIVTLDQLFEFPHVMARSLPE